mmetsp:Transcript_91938/g.154187  ORF Transcript_91938/g.154187 Transcript_91938/m.154187 type:complete len:247 (-) Transcript_91938:21-761(-)
MAVGIGKAAEHQPMGECNPHQPCLTKCAGPCANEDEGARPNELSKHDLRVNHRIGCVNHQRVRIKGHAAHERRHARFTQERSCSLWGRVRQHLRAHHCTAGQRCGSQSRPDRVLCHKLRVPSGHQPIQRAHRCTCQCCCLQGSQERRASKVGQHGDGPHGSKGGAQREGCNGGLPVGGQSLLVLSLQGSVRGLVKLGKFLLTLVLAVDQVEGTGSNTTHSCCLQGKKDEHRQRVRSRGYHRHAGEC